MVAGSPTLPPNISARETKSHLGTAVPELQEICTPPLQLTRGNAQESIDIILKLRLVESVECE